MAIPDYQSLMLPVLSAASHGEVRIREVVQKLGVELGLSAEEIAALLPSGRDTVFNNRVNWAKFYLSKAGLITNTKRGYFNITGRGEQILQTRPVRIDNALLEQFPDFKAWKDASNQNPMQGNGERNSDQGNVADAPETPDEVMRVAHRQIELSLAQEILDRILAAPPDFFERLIVNLLLKMGFGGSAVAAGRALGRSGDDGVDGVIDQDPLGLDRVYVQAKRYVRGNSIGSGAIREFFGSLDRQKATKGLFVTTSTFSAAAKETAEFLSKRIVLIDGEQLTKLMIRYDVGCRIEETLHIKKIDEDFFE